MSYFGQYLGCTRRFGGFPAHFCTAARRAGIESTISQSVRAFGARRSRYRGLAQTHLQQVMTTVAITVRRIIAWVDGIPKARTRVSHFAALAACANRATVRGKVMQGVQHHVFCTAVRIVHGFP